MATSQHSFGWLNCLEVNDSEQGVLGAVWDEFASAAWKTLSG